MDMHQVRLGEDCLYTLQSSSNTEHCRVGNHISTKEQQQNGVPQGSVLSVTLYALKINNIINEIPKDPRFHYSLYVDDLQIGYHHADTKIIEHVLQQ